MLVRILIILKMIKILIKRNIFSIKHSFQTLFNINLLYLFYKSIFIIVIN